MCGIESRSDCGFAPQTRATSHVWSEWPLFANTIQRLVGAHNQRSHITANVSTRGFIWIEELIEMIEKVASCELYGLLKRPDEKYVTEKAYDNPKFVEDIVRDIALEFNNDDRISAYIVESENFESIHNHSAYAMLQHDKEEKK